MSPNATNTTNTTKMKVLIAGGTGQIARPIAEALAAEHEVWVIARFSTPGVKDQLRARGVRTWRWDMGRDSLDGLPTDFTHVLHAAVQRSDNRDFDSAIEANAVGAGQIMTHCRKARAFIYISTGALYAEQKLAADGDCAPQRGVWSARAGRNSRPPVPRDAGSQAGADSSQGRSESRFAVAYG
jgi:nucleoside-diphosphate-sugar epimerase